MSTIINSEAAAKAMLDGLTNLIREKLRERILERIKPDIDGAIEASIESMKLSIASWRDPGEFRETIKVLIEDRRK